MVTMKVFYYDDVTPEDYQPPGWHDATLEEHPFFAESPLVVPVGKVASVRC
jgi:meiosis-specific protein HOP1